MSHASWSVKNTTTQECRVGLDDKALVEFLTSVSAIDFPHWLACRSDEPENWISCLSFLAFRLRPYGFEMIPAHLSMTKPQISWIEQQLQKMRGSPVSSSQAVEKPVWTERRKHARKKMKLQVVLIQGQKAFRTFTRDISLGGMALEKTLPPSFLASDCMIFISDPNSSVKFSFSGKIVQNPDHPSETRCRIQFQEIPAVSRQALEHWIAEFSSSASKAVA